MLTEADPLFNACISQLLQDEGGDSITDDPQDPGGVTKFGVTQHLYTAIGGGDVKLLTEQGAEKVYYDHFWKEYHFDELGKAHPSLAAKAFNFCVNAGPDPAFRCIQRAMRAMGANIKEDGVMGPITRAKVAFLCNTDHPCGQEVMLVAYRSEIAGYYRDLDKPRFEAGWVDRAYR